MSRINIAHMAATGLLCLLPLYAHAEITKCSAEDGSLTYTDGLCSSALTVKSMQGANTSSAPPIMRGTSWALPIKPRPRKTDVESVRAARAALQPIKSRLPAYPGS